jgi:hypothetical protein
LAHSELYLTLATLYARFGDLEIFDFGEENLEFDDYFASYPVRGGRTLKVVRKA